MLNDTFDQVLISEWHMPLLQGSCSPYLSGSRYFGSMRRTNTIL